MRGNDPRLGFVGRDVLGQFSPRNARADRADARLPIHLLLATDVLSEGLDLHQANVLVHLDLPWTAARLEQRLGRLRRMGSPHARVHVYAIGPPPHARELATVVRALQRKVRLVTSLVGLPDAAALDSALGAGSRRSGPDLAAATERVRRTLDAWQQHEPECVSHPALSCDSSPTPSVAVRAIGACDHPWRVLALIETVNAKMRLFRVPEFLATAFLLAVIALLVHVLLGA